MSNGHRHRSLKALCLLGLTLCSILALPGCATGEATLALQRAGRSSSSPGYIEFDLSLNAGAADLGSGEQRLEGKIIEDGESRLSLLQVDVVSLEERVQQVEFYLQRGEEYQPTMYRSIDGVWSAQRVSRAYANQWRDSLSYTVTQDLLKTLRNPTLVESSTQIDGVSCQQVEGAISADRVQPWLEISMFPSFLGFPSHANDSTFYDNAGPISATAYVGRDDGRIYRLVLDLGEALAPLVERMSTTNSSNELWQDIRLRDCRLQVDYREYDQAQTLVLPEAAQAVESI